MKQIIIHNPQNLPTLPWKELHDFQGNFKRTNEEKLRKLTRSIIDHGIFVPKFVWFERGAKKRKALILDGHQTKAALQLLEFDGWEVPPIPYVEVEAADRKDAAAKLLQLNSRYADVNPETTWFAELDFSADELRRLVDGISLPELDVEALLAGLRTDGDGAGEGDGDGADTGPHDIIEEVKAADHVIVNFSGGKDSLLALRWAQRAAKEHGKSLTALMVETGAEFADVTCHAMRVCEALGVDLRLVHLEESILEHYWRKKQWPDSIFMECLHHFINEPCDDWIARELPLQKVVTVRGGRGDQKHQRSKTAEYQEVKLPGGGVKRLLSPFFNSTEEEYQRALNVARDMLWPGYALGFERTACWMCPFQHAKQWDAMREHYPVLWEEMRRLAGELRYKYHPKDPSYKRFRAYWRANGAVGIGLSEDVHDVDPGLDEEAPGDAAPVA